MGVTIKTREHEFKSFETKISTIAQGIKLVLYTCFAVCVVLPLPNPLAKIAVAAYIGVYSVLMFLYTIYVHVSLSSIDPLPAKEDLRQHPMRAIVRRLLNMPSVLIDRALNYLLYFAGVMVRFVFKLDASSSTPRISSKVLSFIILTLRKEVAFLCWAYVTTGDSTAVHYKSFLALCTMTTVHQWFILSQKPDSSSTKSSMWKSKSAHQRSQRWYHSGRLYFGGCLFLAFSIVITMYKHQIEHHHHNDSWLSVIDAQQMLYWFLDMGFTATVFQDMINLDVSVVNSSHGGGVLRSDDERVHLV